LKRTVFCLLICLGCFSTAFSQKPTTTHVDAKQAKPAAKPSFLLTVKTRPILNISLKAEKAKYRVTATARGYQPASIEVEIDGDEARNVGLTLQPVK